MLNFINILLCHVCVHDCALISLEHVFGLLETQQLVSELSVERSKFQYDQAIINARLANDKEKDSTLTESTLKVKKDEEEIGVESLSRLLLKRIKKYISV